MSSASLGSTGSSVNPLMAWVIVAAASSKSSGDAVGICSTTAPASTFKNFLSAHGSLRRSSRSMPLARTEDPRVTPDCSGHSALRSDVRFTAIARF